MMRTLNTHGMASVGYPIDARQVRQARSAEIKYIKDMNLYDKISRHEAESKGMSIIGTRWVDVDKGHELRSRLVAK